jgi:hypothetical protein
MPRQTYHYYRTCGVRLRSALALPELTPAVAGYDVTIRHGAVPSSLPRAQAGGPGVQSNAEAVLLAFQGVGRFLARHGNEILVDRAPGSEAHMVRHLLLSAVMGVVLHQRGMLALHGNAIAVRDGCVALLGPSGAGKSTLAALLQQRGYAILGDDVCAVSVTDVDMPVVWPGCAQLRLYPDSLALLGADRRALPPVQGQKYAVPVRQQAPAVPRRLQRLYVLADGAAPGVHPLTPQEGFGALLDHTYRPFCLAGMGAQPRHFHLCATVARHVPLALFTRPRDLTCLPECLDVLETHLRHG